MSKKYATIYLCGPIHGRSDSACKRWRAIATAMWPGEVLDPMRRDARGRMSEPGVAKEVVEADKRDIDQSAGLLVWFDTPSVGTAMEILYAYEQGKPIVVINASPQENHQASLWLQYHATEIVRAAEWDLLRGQLNSPIGRALCRLDSLVTHGN